MRTKKLLEMYSVFALITCVNFMLVPGFWIVLYGGAPETQALFLYRLIATLFGAVGLMTWLARLAEPSESRLAMIRGLAAGNVLATLVATSGAVTNVYNEFAWGPVITFALFSLGFVQASRSEGAPVAVGA